MPNNSSKNLSLKKKIIIPIIIIAATGAGIFIYLKTGAAKDLMPLVKSKLEELVVKGSNGLYKLRTDSIHLDITKEEITLFNAQLLVDSSRLKQLDSLKQAPDDIFNISLQTLNVNGISVSDILNKKNIDLNNIYLNDPVVKIFHQKRSYNYTAPDTANLYSKIEKNIAHFSLKELFVKNIDFTYTNISANNKQSKFKNLSLDFKNILVDSATQKDTSRFLYAKQAFIFIKDYSINTADNLFTFHFDSALLNAASNSLSVQHVSLKPVGKKSEFSSKLKFYEDRYDINVDSLLMESVDWYSLLAGESITAKEAKLMNGNVEVFADRTLPDDNKIKVGNYPQQILMRVKMPVNIEKIKANNFKVTYTELNPKSNKNGSIVFDNIDAVFTNVTNIDSVIEKNNALQLNANAAFMSSAPLHAVFIFNLKKAKEGVFSVDADLGKMNGTKLNIATEGLAMVHINTLNLNHFTAHINADNSHSSGTVKFLYDDMNVSILSAGKDTSKNKMKLLSFLANNFIIAKSNTEEDKNNDVKQVAQQRNPHRSFFNLIWKSFQDGIIKTVKEKD